MSNHGKPTPSGSGRYCDVHGHHGILYVCDSYPKEIQKEVEDLGHEFRKQCAEGTIKIIHSYAGIVD